MDHLSSDMGKCYLHMFAFVDVLLIYPGKHRVFGNSDGDKCPLP